ncbi:secretory carrier-associated membrane 1 [Brachionus plicatilis]|uniref:Secretory carrier-associated membrane protein n=1 Tax=Brachionus plicatilis TaxID=10195 RepID=A0A3M7T4Y4_BRAPC|nr:secretory carrier-associated membrane 1 [Brachionus plicatilis]
MSNDLNPFSNENPFTDPDIQRVTQTTQIAQESLDDYNPFSQPNIQSKPAAIIPTSTISSSPAENYQTSQLKPPAYSETSAQKLNLTDIEKQQQELNQRAAELDRREQLINNPTIGVKNFPPFPSWCPGPLKPCFYQDINLEIPIEFQRWVRLLFYLWIFHTFTLGFNIIAALVVFIMTGMGATFGYSILYFVLFTPCSYACWFRPAYKGFRTDSSMNFMIFFFVFFCQVIVNFIETVGFVGSGFCGILLLIKVLGTTGVGNVVAGIFVLLATICFVAIAAIDILMLIKIHRLYRNTGASFQKAQAEFATNVMSNKNVQNAAASVVTEGARSAMQSNSRGRF